MTSPPAPAPTSIAALEAYETRLHQLRVLDDDGLIVAEPVDNAHATT